MYNLLFSSSATAGEGSVWETILSFAPLLIVLVVFYFLLIRPQQKKDKEDKAMRENLEIGDEVVTAGGIIGIIVSIKDETVVVETGSGRSRIRVAKWAISQKISSDKEDENQK